MSVRVRITKSFQIAVKPLLKKYPSLKSDLLKLEKELVENPKQGMRLDTILIRYGLRFPAKEKVKAAEQE